MTKTNRLQKKFTLSRNRFFYDSNNNLVLFQWPNITLSLWIFFTILAKLTTSNVQDTFSLVASISLTIWAIIEITTGVNYFRRTLGLTILAYIMYTRLF